MPSVGPVGTSGVGPTGNDVSSNGEKPGNPPKPGGKSKGGLKGLPWKSPKVVGKSMPPNGENGGNGNGTPGARGEDVIINNALFRDTSLAYEYNTGIFLSLQ